MILLGGLYDRPLFCFFEFLTYLPQYIVQKYENIVEKHLIRYMGLSIIDSIFLNKGDIFEKISGSINRDNDGFLKRQRCYSNKR